MESVCMNNYIIINLDLESGQYYCDERGLIMLGNNSSFRWSQ